MYNRAALTSDTFSWDSALSLALASQLAYARDDAGLIAMATTTWGFTGCIPVTAGATRVFVAWDQGTAIVCFRGTESIGDWLLNGQVAPVTRPYGRVHGGFSEGFEAIRAGLEEALRQADPGTKRLWLTGHSLGGALATVTAAELRDRYAITGLYTYGQPKSVGAAAAQSIDGTYQRYFRFVNDDDIVPGVPPGYRHVGRLIWFDAQGRVQSGTPGTEAEAGADAPRELSEAEFAELRRRLRVLETATQAEVSLSLGGVEAAAGTGRTADAQQALFDTSVEGLFPSVRDHGIARYVAQIRRQLDRPAVLDDAIAKAVIAFNGEAFAVELEGATRGAPLIAAAKVHALLRVRAPNWEAPPGVAVQSRLGNVISVAAPADLLADLRDDPGVVSIESSRPGGTLELANSKPFVHATEVHRPPLAEMGDAALVGLIDTGVDVLHEAFRDDAGNTRILWIWDQRASAGTAPKGVDPAAFTQSYGTLYGQPEIAGMIRQGSAPAALRDPGLHGTHVASIAAGRAVGSFAGGLAPAAGLIVVIPAMAIAPGDPQSLGYSTSHVDALAFIQAAAARAGKPVAINVSLGMNAGAHDGSSTLEAAFDACTDMGRLPGIVIVKSAGNERGFRGHARADVPYNGLAEIAWDALGDQRSEDYIEAWFHAFDDIDFTLVDPAGGAAATVTVANPEVTAELNGNLCRLKLSRNHRDNGDNLLTLTIASDVSPIQGGRWTLRMLGRTILSPGAGVVHAWVERDGSRAVSFRSGDNDEMTLSIPGTANHVITVAASGSDLPVQLTSSSSWGPTRKGGAKPDLCAPGTAIVAAAANTANHQETMALTGTSMAAPHVTGAVALALSRRHKDPGKPQVNAVQVQRELIASAQNFTGVYNKGSGFGVLDALAFVNRF